MMATSRDYTEIISELLKVPGVDVNVNCPLDTALVTATNCDDEKTVKRFLNHLNMDLSKKFI